MRWAMTRVLPLPAPARTRSGPSVWTTASCWAGFSPARISSGTRPRPSPPRSAPPPRPRPAFVGDLHYHVPQAVQQDDEPGKGGSGRREDAHEQPEQRAHVGVPAVGPEEGDESAPVPDEDEE